jgi:hypothetical protein
MTTEPRIPGCAETLPGISMDPDAHCARPRSWDKIIFGRPLTDARIVAYIRAGKYDRAQIKVPGGRLVCSA